MTDATLTVIISNAIIAGGGITKVIVDELRRRGDRLNREQDRLDRDQLARFTSEQLESARLAGDARLKTIVDEVNKTRSVAIKAFKEANGVNKKIERLGQKLTGPQKLLP